MGATDTSAPDARLRAFKHRLEPNPAQFAELTQCAGVARRPWH